MPKNCRFFGTALSRRRTRARAGCGWPIVEIERFNHKIQSFRFTINAPLTGVEANRRIDTAFVGCVMSMLVRVLKGRSAIALVFASAAAALLAGCSSDVTQISNPFQESSRFGTPDRAATGTISPRAPVRHVMAEPLPARIEASPLAPVRPSASANWTHEALAAPPHPNPAMREQPVASGRRETVATAHGAWSADGGTPITVGGGDSGSILANRYNVPLDVLLRVNGFASATSIRPGGRIIIPVYNADNGSRSGEHAAAREPKFAQAERHESQSRPVERFHFVKGPDSAADRRAIEKSPHDKSARDNAVKEHGKVAADRDRDEISHGSARDRRSADANKSSKSDRAAQMETTRRQEASAKTDDHAKAIQAHAKAIGHKADSRQAAAAETKRASSDVATAKKPALDKTATGSLPPAQSQIAAGDGSGHPDFRWPAHGRIIEGFKTGSNDGINIAVPDGTTVRAADDGVVAYAGNELKGYGNLVLIRHPNGFVSAYANNGEIDVKRGEAVKRGQAIAKSGQSGNVSSPQLHFELRKGQTPVDPTRFLAGL